MAAATQTASGLTNYAASAAVNRQNGFKVSVTAVKSARMEARRHQDVEAPGSCESSSNMASRSTILASSFPSPASSTRYPPSTDADHPARSASPSQYPPPNPLFPHHGSASHPFPSDPLSSVEFSHHPGGHASGCEMAEALLDYRRWLEHKERVSGAEAAAVGFAVLRRVRKGLEAVMGLHHMHAPSHFHGAHWHREEGELESCLWELEKNINMIGAHHERHPAKLYLQLAAIHSTEAARLLRFL